MTRQKIFLLFYWQWFLLKPSPVQRILNHVLFISLTWYPEVGVCCTIALRSVVTTVPTSLRLCSSLLPSPTSCSTACTSCDSTLPLSSHCNPASSCWSSATPHTNPQSWGEGSVTMGNCIPWGLIPSDLLLASWIHKKKSPVPHVVLPDWRSNCIHITFFDYLHPSANTIAM